MRRSISQCVCFAAILVAGCEWPGKPKPVENGGLPTKMVDFEGLFETNCRGCHGGNGEGGPAPPLNDAIFLEIVPEEELVSVVTNGRPGTPMPPFVIPKGGRLEEFQVKILAKGMKEHWGRPVELKDIPPYTMVPGGDPQRGSKVFATACSSCHGSDGQEGATPSDAGPIHDQSFLALTSSQLIRRLVITGRPDLGMPNFSQNKSRPPDFKPLSAQEVTDLTAYVNSWRKTASNR